MVEAAAPLVDKRRWSIRRAQRCARSAHHAVAGRAGAGRNQPEPTAAACCSRCWSGAARWAMRSRSIPHAPSSTRSRSAHEARHPRATPSCIRPSAWSRPRARSATACACSIRCAATCASAAEASTCTTGAGRSPATARVIPRVGASITRYGTAVLRQFEFDGQLHAESVRRDRARA